MRHRIAQAAPVARGKNAKLKKAKQKYADQDEEDRRLAMEALASAGWRRFSNWLPLHQSLL